MNAFVIKSWFAASEADASGNYVYIQGRSGGFISWLLNLLGISPTVSLVVTSDKISFQKGSLEGTLSFLTPLENTCSTFYAYRRPLKEALILGVLVGLATFFFFGIPGIVVAILYYALNKTLTIGFTDLGGRVSEVPFKRSIIENQAIDEAAAARVCEIVQQLVDRCRNKILTTI